MFKMVYEDFRAEFYDNLKREKKNVWIYIIFIVIYGFLFIDLFMKDRKRIVFPSSFLMLFIVIQGSHKIYPNLISKIKLLLPLTRDEKYKYLKTRLVIKQFFLLAIVGSVNLLFVLAGMIELNVFVLLLLNVILLSTYMGIITNRYDYQVTNFKEFVNLFIGAGNYVFILNNREIFTIKEDTSYVIIICLLVAQMVGTAYAIFKFNSYARIDGNE